MRVGVVSDIHYPLRPHFDHYGLGTFVDSYTLSFEHGVQKPHPRLFQIALEQLGAPGSGATPSPTEPGSVVALAQLDPRRCGASRR